MTGTLSRLIICCLAGFLGWASIALADTQSRTVRDWTGTCDEYACTARVTADGGQMGYQLELSRLSGGNDGWMVTLIASNVPQPEPDSVATFDITGYDLPPAGFVTLSEDRFGVSQQDALEVIVPALRQGDDAKLSFVSKDVTQDQTFSLSGIAAVLLWIDEYQGRVGNSVQVTAAEGNAGAEAQLKGDAATKLRQELLSTSVAEDCQWNIPGEGTDSFNAEAHELGDGYSLYIVTCSRGAYQPSTMVFVRGIDAPRTVAFADYSTETGWTGTNELGFVEFDPKTRILQNYVKFRGIGDCGAKSKFLWTGYQFKLLEFAYKDCTGEPVDENAEVGDFPIIYTAQ